MLLRWFTDFNKKFFDWNNLNTYLLNKEIKKKSLINRLKTKLPFSMLKFWQCAECRNICCQDNGRRSSLQCWARFKTYNPWPGRDGCSSYGWETNGSRFLFLFLPLNIFFLNKDLYLGGVACLKGIKHPIEAARYSTLLYVFNFLNFSLIYRSVMENSSHVLLVGEGARKFTIK